MTEHKQSTCRRCGAMIYLVKGGTSRATTKKAAETWFRWVTRPDKPGDTWKCQTSREFPLRSHEPRDA